MPLYTSKRTPSKGNSTEPFIIINLKLNVVVQTYSAKYCLNSNVIILSINKLVSLGGRDILVRSKFKILMIQTAIKLKP